MNQKNKSIFGTIPPIAQYVGVGVSAFLVYLLLRGGAPFNHDIQVPKPVAKIQSNVKVALAPMMLTGANTQNHFTLNGSVPSEAIKSQIDTELRTVFGEGHYTNNLKVDDNIKPPKWLAHTKGFFDFFKLTGSELSTNDDIITLSGTAIPLKDPITTFVGEGTTVKALDLVGNVKTANLSADAALDALSVNSSTKDILDALNLQIINFASGSTQIPAVNQAVLKKAAVLLKGKTDAFEVSGHADNQGNAASNLKLSEARAKSVREFLVKQQVPSANMSAKGYGDTLPVASNDTEPGRLQNRRIEFKVTP